MKTSKALVTTIFPVLVLMATQAVGGCDAGDPASAERESADLSSAAPIGSLRVDCGGPAVAPYGADVDFKGGTTIKSDKPINTSGVSSPAPAAVYQTARVGNFSYKLGGFAAAAPYEIRLHFAETYWTKPGQREFDVAINDTPVLNRFDVFKAAGGKNVALVEEFSLPASSVGTFTIKLTSFKDKSLIAGIEVLARTSNGAACTAATQCASGNCVDGVCCGSASCGSCQACNLPGSAGACAAVAAGVTDPRGVCANQGPATCGTNGLCDGVGGCQQYGQGTVCASPSCPAGSSTLTLQGSCSGAGACVSGTVSCAPYLCGAANACGFSCASDVDCAASFHCNPATGTCG
jgi:hypothetical protein